jgi:hypothetical protein
MAGLTRKHRYAPPGISLAAKIELYSIPVTESGCILWAACVNADGYGILVFNKKKYLAHRASWMLENGEIPRGLNVLHKCDVPSCVNTAHLFIGTQQDNVADMIAKQRNAKKVMAVDVMRIRGDRRQCKAIAAEYNISVVQVSKIKRRAAWASLGVIDE